MAEFSTSLIVRGESVQSLYTQFRSGRLAVNRRYQRKLVWTEDEKKAFIDSLVQDMPVPLILVAEVVEDGQERLEVIDGLQRLNAVFSFMENEYGIINGYFDLNSLAETKQLLDEGALIQNSPVLDRSLCVDIAGYTLPVSAYRTSSNEKVDEVFRRINSNGRHLSRQEIRQAGCLSIYADTVRKISAAIRGDYSVSDMLDLKAMPAISISSSPERPGVFVDEIFWVRHRILDREQVRTSRDEEIVADLLVTMLSEPTPPYDSRVLDEFYGLTPSTESRADKIETAILRYSPEEVQSRFDDTIAAFNTVFDRGHVFSTHFFSAPRQRVPRYFEVVFLALDTILHKEGLSVLDYDAIRADLKDFGSKHIDIPGGGGRWTANSKKQNIDVVAGILRRNAIAGSVSTGPFETKNALVVERLLKASLVETSTLELKQGFSILSGTPSLSGDIVNEVARTSGAIANGGKGFEGYILVGIADKSADASRVTKLSGRDCPEIEGRYVTGIEIDVDQLGSIDDVLLWFTEKYKSCLVDSRLEAQVLRDMRVARIAERTVLILKVVDVGEPVAVSNSFYTRSGSQTLEVAAADVGRLFARFA
ncbi:DUF262 domain-containing protein [Phytoactinopolyspora halotolerans]|uniref:DUF262 domain-containing protein n=1 Tax=Phytoactinopolyspora halotolerans TaxID=1981512 RepID=A0A6L9SAJ7_9ACTN|nr:DUF262 domain-containing protein [Phytoactinopolyspora halotolerans]NEE02063.1 DUF262 domain-containing protein [Phytoactinopolyspora halotolerans]